MSLRYFGSDRVQLEQHFPAVQPARPIATGPEFMLTTFDVAHPMQYVASQEGTQGLAVSTLDGSGENCSIAYWLPRIVAG